MFRLTVILAQLRYNSLMIDIMTEAARAGGKVLLSYFQKELQISHKTSHQNLVTQADVESQKIIQATIVKLMKAKGYQEEEIGFIGEEGNLRVKGKFTFVIDPLDGTSNFASGIEFFGVYIALLVDRELQAGVMYAPVFDEIYFAQKDKGAYKEKNSRVNKLELAVKPLKEQILGTYFTSDTKKRDNTNKKVFQLAKHLRGLRCYGGISGIMLLENYCNIYVEGSPKLWDVAAEKIVVEEAGGKVCDWNGQEISLHIDQPHQSHEVIVCHHSQIKEIVRLMNA